MAMQEDLAAEPIPRGKDASMHLHLPASEYSQDTSHVFTSIFKDTYTKEVIGRDTASNLSKTKRGSSDHHEKHVEELEQIHSKNAECTKQADMLEKHITQARVRVAATEAQTRARLLEEMGEAYDQLGLPPARSTFQWCVDSDLLKRNNLIGPQDYRPDSRAERESYAARSAARDQTGGKPRDGSECSLQTLDGTLPRSDVVVKRKSSHVGAKCRPSVPKAASKSSDQSVAAARDSFKKLKAPQNVPRNPRFLPPHVNSLVRAPRGSKGEKKKSLREATTLSLLSTTDESVSVFQATPQVVSFTEYTVGQVYETSLELKNLTASSRYIRVIPPTTTYFSIGLGRFPGEGGMVAPGMCCKYTVRFAPDSLGDFEDYVVVETEAPQPLLVPLVARRPPPILSLPRVLDCGPSLVGGVKLVEYLCCNQGLSGGSFCIMPRSQWPASNLRTVVMSSFAPEPPFAISPLLFQLRPGQATVVKVVFNPTAAESYSQDFTVVCDNCQVKDITIQGEGQSIALELVSVSGENTLPVWGEERDLAAEHFVRFPSCHPHCVERKTAVIKNHTDLELPFFWQVMMPNLQSLLPGEEPDLARIHFHPATDDVFHVSPLIGSLAPRQDQAFEFTYLPKELKDHHSVCQLVVRDVPQCPTESGQSGAPKMSHVIVMEVEVKGSTKPYQLRLEPSAVVLPGKPFVGTTTRTKFKLWNHSTSGVLFHWERMNDCHIMEVEPCRGEIEVNACAQLDLVVTGGRPEKVVTSLLCHIEKHHQPLGLPVEVSFKGPELTLSDPILDLGLQRLGEESHRTVLLTNTSPLEASWTLGKSGSGGPEDPQLVSLEPRRGVLAAQASCRLDVVFRALACGHFDALLEISVEQGSECYLSVRADVESPRVCLSSSELAFSEIYVGVPANGVVSLVNRSLLPAHFAWTSQLQGKQASLCSASFRPPSGTLDPHATVDVAVEYTSHTDLEVRDVSALCSVQGMDLPVVLNISSKAKTLSVSYSVRNQKSSEGQMDASPALLDFGDKVILKTDEVTLQLTITNHSAIAAPFTIEAEYFAAHAPAPSGPDSQSKKGLKYQWKPHFPSQVKKMEEKAHQEFVEALLSHEKGAAFLVRPGNGMLAPFDKRVVEVTAYSNMWGEYRDHLVCKVGDLEPRLIPVRMSVSGCPLYFQMFGPRPASAPIVRFGTCLSGGDTVSRSLRINNPSPYDIRMDWETYNVDDNDRQLVDVVMSCGDFFPLKDADGNELVGGALALPNKNQSVWGRERTPSSKRTSPSLSSEPDVVDDPHPTVEDSVVVEEDEGKGTLSPRRRQRKVFSVFIRPHVGLLSDYPYCITPQQTVIPAKGSATVHVSFTPLTLSGATANASCVGQALGFMSLDSRGAACIPGKVQRAQGLDLEPLRMDLQAVVKSALLTVQMEDDDGALEFHGSVRDLLQAESENRTSVRHFDVSQSMGLRNHLQMPLSFRLETQPPFSVLHPRPCARTSSSSNPPTGDGHPLLLQPQSVLKVKVSFHCSLSLLEQVQVLEEAPPTPVSHDSPVSSVSSVSPVRGGGGKRTLKFLQNLVIRYSNNSIQTVPLSARLDVPGPWLSRDSVDFGLCNVGQTQLAHVSLLSYDTDGCWRASIETRDEEDSHVFSVTPDCGVLRGPEPTPTTRGQQHLQISFTASEVREFRATVTIQGALIEPSLKLCLLGRGAYDKARRSSLVSFR